MNGTGIARIRQTEAKAEWEEHRRKGIGRKLFGEALHLLARSGASTAILIVDDDDDTGPRDRTSAKRIYRSFGFVEVDRLWSYEAV